jgi:hypothetical protein
MSNQRIISAKTFEANKVGYAPAKVNKRGGKSVLLNYESDALRIQFPLMLTWGVNERVDDQSGRVSYDMALQFEPNKSQTQAKWLEEMKELEAKVKKDIMKNSKAWLGKAQNNEAVIDALFYPILKYPKLKDGSGEPDYSRNPTLKLKVPFWEGRFNVELYDMNQTPLYIPPKQGSTGNRANGQTDTSTPTDFVPSASHVVGILQCNGLWFAGGKCGVTWGLKQACVRPPQRLVGMGRCAVVMDSDDEGMEQQLTKKDEELAKDDEEEEDQSTPHFTVESESEEEEEEEEEVPVVVAPKKKKVVRRKKKNVGAEA